MCAELSGAAARSRFSGLQTSHPIQLSIILLYLQSRSSPSPSSKPPPPLPGLPPWAPHPLPPVCPPLPRASSLCTGRGRFLEPEHFSPSSESNSNSSQQPPKACVTSATHSPPHSPLLTRLQPWCSRCSQKMPNSSGSRVLAPYLGWSSSGLSGVAPSYHHHLERPLPWSPGRCSSAPPIRESVSGFVALGAAWTSPVDVRTILS